MTTSEIAKLNNKEAAITFKELEQLYKNATALVHIDPKTALELVNETIDKAIELEVPEYVVQGTIFKAWCINSLGRSNEALDIFNEAKHLHQQYTPNNKDHLAEILLHRGLVYLERGNYQLALDGFLGSLPLYDVETRAVYANIGIVYSKMGDHSKAIEFFQKAEVLAQNDGIGAIIRAKNNLAESYQNAGKIQQAKPIVLEALRLAEMHPDKKQSIGWSYAHTLSILGEIYLQEKKNKEAIDILRQALNRMQETSPPYLLCQIHSNIAKVYFAKQEEEYALEHVHEILHYANESKLQEAKKETLEDTVQFYKNTNQLDKAFPFYEMLYEISQEQLKASRNENLQKIIAEREQEIELLEEKNKEIEEQNAILKQFAYVISHDLREPIRGITGFAQMLNNKYAENLDKTANEYLRFILSEANSMNRNLDRLLEYATIEKSVETIKEIDLQQIITKIQQQYQDESFQLDISYEDVSIKMQRQHAILLLSELIGNAIQFRKENQDCRIEIKCELKTGYYQLFVKDYGIGIDPAYHDKIFKIFNKINKWEGTGAGVGLAICERIVQLYKGEISVESIPNQFTTFRIKIAG